MKLTAEEFARFNPLNNWVIIKPDPGNHKIILKSGVELHLNTEVEKEKHAVTVGTVVKVPQALKFHAKDAYHYTTLSYITDQELKPGDRVIFHYQESMENLRAGRYIEYNGEVYFTVKYDRVFLVMKEDSVVPVNGGVIIEAIDEPLPKTSLILPDSMYGKKSETMGVIRYIGSPLKGYYDYQDEGEDADQLKVGDYVRFRKVNSTPIQYSLHQSIDKDATLYRMHRRDIMGTFVPEEIHERVS